MLAGGVMIVGGMMIVCDHIVVGSHRFRLGVADDENGLGVLENAGNGRQRLVGRVDL
jgi:hypothetical protein